jgi:hypothetical protein
MSLDERIIAARRRLGIGMAQGQKPLSLPRLSPGQIDALEKVYPVRLLKAGESVDSYRHYCGAADLVQQLKEVSQPIEGDMGDDEELDIEAVGLAIAQANGTLPTEE